jgi:hypothetical protein
MKLNHPARRRGTVRAVRLPAIAAGALTAVLAMSGCGMISEANATSIPSAVPSATAAVVEQVDQAQFTRDGTFQSHIKVDGIDFVYTIYPTKSTPRTNLWFPRGDKFFTVTLTAYDLDQDLRSSFAKKRLVYLDRIKVTSSTTTSTDSGGSESPYSLDERAARITFDPQPTQHRKYGMLVTSPKGAFELRNQAIGTVSDDTTEVTLKFSAKVYVQRERGSSSYDRQTITQEVPITIFASSEETEVTKIPINAN